MQGAAPDPLADAMRMVQSGALDKARHVVRRVLADTPSSISGLTLAGQIAIRGAAVADAVRYFGRATQADGNRDPRALLNFARAQEMAGRADDALITAQRAVRLFSDDARPRALLAILHLQARRVDAAARAVEPGDARSIDHDTAYKVGRGLATEPLYRDQALEFLAAAASAPGRFLDAALRDIALIAAPDDPRAYRAARRALILVPASPNMAGALEYALGARRHPVKQAAWAWRTSLMTPGDQTLLERAAELTYTVKWPKHGVAANRNLLARRPNDLALVTRICELFARHFELSDDKAAAREEALAWGREVLAAEPKDPRIWDVLAGLYKDVAAIPEASALWEQTLARFRGYQVLYYNYGLFLDEQERSEDAIRALRRALLLKPDYLRASNLLSMVMTHVHDLDAALRYVRWAIRSRPRHPTCWINYGTYLRAVGDYTQAIEAFRRGEQTAGSDENLKASATFNAGMSHITIGELEPGFRMIESRWATKGFPSPRRKFAQKIWRGPDNHPMTRLLAYTEQGLGDEVMMSWYFPLLRQDTRRLVVDCDERLVDVFARTYEGIEFVPRSLAGHDKVRDRDLRHKVPMLHVPQYYVPELKFLIRDNWDWNERRGERFPSRLAVDPARLARWDAWLAERFPGRTRLALSWRSKMRNRTRDQQYLTIEELAEALPEGSVAINLQYSSTEEELDQLRELGLRRGFDVVTPDGVDLTDDLEDVFALLQVSDAAVTPMISLAWMAGAVGCPGYIFRTSRERTIWQQFGTPFVPWGPSMRLFFRDPSESWRPVIGDLRSRLERYLATLPGR